MVLHVEHYCLMNIQSLFCNNYNIAYYSIEQLHNLNTKVKRSSLSLGFHFQQKEEGESNKIKISHYNLIQACGQLNSFILKKLEI